MRKVSAIITTRNRSELLPRAVNSVMEQTFAVFECIIVDDCSEDNTRKVSNDLIKKYGSRLIYHRLTTQSGACVARNIATEISSGDFIAGIDDDDEWTKDRIEVLLNNYNPDLAYVTGRNLMLLPNYKQKKSQNPLKITVKKMLAYNCAGNQILTEKSKILQVGGSDPNLTAAQDYDLYLRLNEMYGDAICVNKVLQIIHQEHQKGNITQKAKLGYINFYFKHILKFNRRQKVCQIFRIKQITGGEIKLKYLCFAQDFFVFSKMLKYYILKLFYPQHRTN